MKRIAVYNDWGVCVLTDPFDKILTDWHDHIEAAHKLGLALAEIEADFKSWEAQMVKTFISDLFDNIPKGKKYGLICVTCR